MLLFANLKVYVPLRILLRFSGSIPIYEVISFKEIWLNKDGRFTTSFKYLFSGIIILLDARSHQIIKQISLVSSNQKIEEALNNALIAKD